MPKLNMVQALNLALDQEMAKNPDVVLLGQDIGPDGGVFRVTDNLHAKYGEDRVIDTPLAESGILGTAIGMAMGGLRPVAEMQFCGFSYLMTGQWEGHARRFRSRTQGHVGLPLVVRFPYGGGVRALEHHSESPEATYAHFAGSKVVICSGPRNARALLVAAIRDPDPVVFFEPKHAYRAFREEVPEEEEVLPIGVAQVVKPGERLTLIGWGAMMHMLEGAVAEIEKQHGEGTVEVIDLMTIAPMDTPTLVASVKKTRRCVIVQEAPRSFGVASEIIAVLNDQCLEYLEAPVKRVTGFDVVTPYFGREQGYIPKAHWVVDAVNQTLAYR